MVCKLRFKCRNWRFSNHDSPDTHIYEFFMSRPRERVVRRKEIDDFIVVAAATSSSPIAISELYGKL